MTVAQTRGGGTHVAIHCNRDKPMEKGVQKMDSLPVRELLGREHAVAVSVRVGEALALKAGKSTIIANEQD